MPKHFGIWSQFWLEVDKHPPTLTAAGEQGKYREHVKAKLPHHVCAVYSVRHQPGAPFGASSCSAVKGGASQTTAVSPQDPAASGLRPSCNSYHLEASVSFGG